MAHRVFDWLIHFWNIELDMKHADVLTIAYNAHIIFSLDQTTFCRDFIAHRFNVLST